MKKLIKFDKDYPVPKGNRSVYNFGLMEVGDSFFTQKIGVGAAASQYGKAHNMRFKTRKVIESGKAGWRVWREA